LFSRIILHPILRRAVAGLLFVVVWGLLNFLFNLRYPARLIEPPWWYLLPSMDATALLGILALLALLGRELPRRVIGGLVAVVLFVRLFRFADGMIQQNYFRPVNLALDVPLLPELGRLLASTVPWYQLVLGGLVILLALGLAVLILSAALIHAQRFLGASRWHQGAFAAAVLALVALAPMWPRDHHVELHKGLFGLSVVPVLADQAKHAGRSSTLAFIKATEIAAVQRRLKHTPKDLQQLRGADVQFILLESYGSTVFRNREHLERVQSSLDAFTILMGQLGYFTASSTLDSSTYGGGSWLAHATLASGVRIADGRDFAVIRNVDLPITMASAFGSAGYRSVVVQPGTTRRFPEGEVRGFAAKYYVPDLGYQGPPFGWATMPDQYVIDFIHRKEIAPSRVPVFAQFALVSSHAPWSVQPPVVEDWSEIGDGKIFHQLGARTYPITWSTMSRGGDAYAESILYDFEVMKRYIAQMVERPTFFILMGDHQPPILPGDDASPSVPVHLLSKDQALIARFAQAGFVPGMIPVDNRRPPGMESFFQTLLERLSGSPSSLAGPLPPSKPATRHVR
jgi:hypothetical protein